jgi:hypothetical protein
LGAGYPAHLLFQEIQEFKNRLFKNRFCLNPWKRSRKPKVWSGSAEAEPGGLRGNDLSLPPAERSEGGPGLVPGFVLFEIWRALREPCMVALSGYWSSLYASMLQDWRSISYMVGVQGGQAREEWLWMNYPEPAALHDYRYLGENFREREKITRQKRRWRARLLRMSSLQRYALLSSIAELNEPRGS